MFRNRKFGFCAAALCLTGFAYTLLCACLAGRPATGADAAVRAGAFCAVPAAFLCLEGYRRRGVRLGMILWGAAAALGCVGLANAGGIRWLFFASRVLVCSAGAALRIGVALLCCQWFIRCRGRALALTAMGAPVFYAAAGLLRTHPGGDVLPFYLAAAAALVLLAPAVRFLLRDAPEDAGLYPDGDGRAPVGEPDGPEPPFSMGQLLADRRFWLTLAVTGALTAAAAGCLGTAEARLLARAGGGTTLLGHAAPWLVRGTVLAIPACLLFGWLCDRPGALWAALPLFLAELGCAWLLWTFPKDVDTSTGAALCLTAACLLGGVPVVVPALIVRAFGRQRLLSVCRALFPALALAAALAGPGADLLGGGERARLYAVLMAAAAAGLVCLPVLGRTLRKKGD